MIDYQNIPKIKTQKNFDRQEFIDRSLSCAKFVKLMFVLLVKAQPGPKSMSSIKDLSFMRFYLLNRE